MGTIYGGPGGTTSAPASSAATAAAEAQVRRCAGWIGAIALFTIVNSIVVAAGANVNFLIGLGVTTFVDVLAKEVAGGAGTGVALTVAFVAGGIFGLFWYFGRKGGSWAFIVATILYGLDTGVYVLLALLGGAALFFNVLLHGVALFNIIKGIGAANTLSRLKQQSAALVPGAISTSAGQ